MVHENNVVSETGRFSSHLGTISQYVVNILDKFASEVFIFVNLKCLNKYLDDYMVWKTDASSSPF